MSEWPSSCLNPGDLEEHLRYRRQLSLVGEAVFRSAAYGRRGIDPAAPRDQVLAALLGGARRRFVYHWERQTEVCFWDGGALVVADVYADSAGVSVFAVTDDARLRLEAVCARLAPFDVPPTGPPGVWVRFASWDGDAASLRSRPVEAPEFASIRDNYPACARAAIDDLAGDATPWERGRLVLWSGPAGTGKTFALRALLSAWKDRFAFVSIQDPGEFTGRPAYYLDLVERTGEAGGRPLLIVVEDGADLVLADSRDEDGDRVGMLLNLTDGLAGQGRRDLIVITFNEDLAHVDSAFRRPGRCRAAVPFPALSRDESNAWLARHGLPPAAEGEMTLAELYERLHDARRAAGERAAGSPADDGGPSKRIGFGAGKRAPELLQAPADSGKMGLL